MKLLLDENLPHQLRGMLAGHDCFTVAYLGWSGIENGELLRLAFANGFDAFITTDKGLEHEQNQSTLPLAVVVLLAEDNKLKTIRALAPSLLHALSDLKANRLVRIGASE